MITTDRGLVELGASVFLKIRDPLSAVCQVQDRNNSTRTLANTMLYRYISKKRICEITNPQDRRILAANFKVRFFLPFFGYSAVAFCYGAGKTLLFFLILQFYSIFYHLPLFFSRNIQMFTVISPVSGWIGHICCPIRYRSNRSRNVRCKSPERRREYGNGRPELRCKFRDREANLECEFLAPKFP